MAKTTLDMALTAFPHAGVWTAPFIKPIDEAQVAKICKESRVVVTLEEHSVKGGLGSLVAEIAAERAPVPILRIGVKDRFSEHCGTYDYLLHEHGLNRTAVEQQVRAFCAAWS